MPEIVAELRRILIDASKAELQATGAVPRPQVHMFAEDMTQPYIGFVTCRPFYRGQDALDAIGELGALPSVMKMTRLTVLWEQLDLATALGDQDGPGSMALMLADARLKGHTLHRHPFRAVPTGRVVGGVPSVTLRWETPHAVKDPVLPLPISRLLRTWRAFRDGDMQETAVGLQRAGYRLDWVTRGAQENS